MSVPSNWKPQTVVDHNGHIWQQFDVKYYVETDDKWLTVVLYAPNRALAEEYLECLKKTGELSHQNLYQEE